MYVHIKSLDMLNSIREEGLGKEQDQPIEPGQRDNNDSLLSHAV